MTKYIKITIPSERYEDYDDCCAAAAADYVEEHGLESWQVEARWADDSRAEIELEVPE